MQGSCDERRELVEQWLIGWGFFDAGPAQLGHERRMEMKAKSRRFLLCGKRHRHAPRSSGGDLKLLCKRLPGIERCYVGQGDERKRNCNPLVFQAFHGFSKT